MSEESIFHQIAQGDIPSKKVYENEEFTAVLDKRPAREGHVIVLPKQPAQVSAQYNGKMCKDLSKALKKVSEKILQSLDAEGTTIFTANGGAAGQRAPYSIFHVIPRKESDDLQLQPVPTEMDEAKHEAAKKRLRGALGMQAPEPETEAEPEFDVGYAEGRRFNF